MLSTKELSQLLNAIAAMPQVTIDTEPPLMCVTENVMKMISNWHAGIKNIEISFKLTEEKTAELKIKIPKEADNG